MITKRNTLFRRLAWIGIAAVLAWAVPFARAQEKQQFQLNEKVSEGLQKLKPLQDAKNFDGMMQLVDSLLASVPPTSYDAAYLLDMKAKLFLNKEQYGAAIEPWEKALKLSDQFGYFDERNGGTPPVDATTLSMWLAQIIFSQAQDLKDKALQQQEINHAAVYLKRYLDHAKNPAPSTQTLYAQILFFRATADPQHINMEMLKEARAIVMKGLQSSLNPQEGFYMMLLAILQQENDMAYSADVLELTLKKFPNKKDLWGTLMMTYLNLANNTKDETEQRNYYARAINAVERAQKLGFMNTPRENFALVTIYLNAGQYSTATQMLHEGMKSGKIESTPANWIILGTFYQQANKEFQAIEALQEGAKLFPTEGKIEHLIGQIYQQMDKPKEARAAYQRAIAKGNLERPHLTYLYLASTEFELEDYDAALKDITAAAKFPDGAKDQQVMRLKTGIETMLKEREREKAAREEALKKL